MIMLASFTPLLLGGLLPALLFSASALAHQTSLLNGGTPASYLIVGGGAIALTGLSWQVTSPGTVAVPWPALFWSLVGGVLWAVANGTIAYVLERYASVSLAQLAPLINVNALLTSLLALGLFGASPSLAVEQLVGGAVLIGLGSLLVITA